MHPLVPGSPGGLYRTIASDFYNLTPLNVPDGEVIAESVLLALAKVTADAAIRVITVWLR